MKRTAKLVFGVAAFAVVLALTAGCREGQKTNPLRRASASGMTTPAGEAPGRPPGSTGITVPGEP
jgi:hypothetical protein